MNYVADTGLWNVKPIKEDGKDTGNDGWIVSAYACKAGLPIEEDKLSDTFQKLRRSNFSIIPTERLPNKKEPPLSRDVILGMVYFNLLDVDDLIESGWYFGAVEPPKFNLVKLLKQLWKLRKAHRNTFWKENGYEQVYRLAYMIPFQDRAFHYIRSGKKAPVIYRIIEWVDKKQGSGSDSGALIRWLKYDLKPDSEVFERYFKSGHPIAIAEKYDKTM
jgi:hypothetical protein